MACNHVYCFLFSSRNPLDIDMTNLLHSTNLLWFEILRPLIKSHNETETILLLNKWNKKCLRMDKTNRKVKNNFLPHHSRPYDLHLRRSAWAKCDYYWLPLTPTMTPNDSQWLLLTPTNSYWHPLPPNDSLLLPKWHWSMVVNVLFCGSQWESVGVSRSVLVAPLFKDIVDASFWEFGNDRTIYRTKGCRSSSD